MRHIFQRRLALMTALALCLLLLPAPASAAPSDAGAPFTDVETGAYYADAVTWAVSQGITTGTGETTFGPFETCTRAQAVTFLYRKAGEPSVFVNSNPFSDVKADAYYADAVAWAVAEGITTGTSETTFSPDAICNRAQIVTLLYRAAGEPSIAGLKNPFSDVKSDTYYVNAVIWAVSKGITTGSGETTFAPDDPCNRAQIVTFLYREAAANYKPYYTKIVTSASVSDTDRYMDTDSNGGLIYFDEAKNQILRLDVAAETQELLFDVGSASYTVTNNGAFAVYTGLKLYQIFWDDVNQQLIVDGQFTTRAELDGGWTDMTGTFPGSYRALFTLQNRELSHISDIPNTMIYDEYNEYSYQNGRLICSLGNGIYLVECNQTRPLVSGNTRYWVTYSFQTKKVLTRLGYQSLIVPHGFVSDGTIYLAYSTKLSKYDYAANQAVTVASFDTTRSAMDMWDGILYSWGDNKIYANRFNGQQKVMVDMANDVDVQDMLALPVDPTGLFVVSENTYLFYDARAGMIRAILATPDD